MPAGSFLTERGGGRYPYSPVAFPFHARRQPSRYHGMGGHVGPPLRRNLLSMPPQDCYHYDTGRTAVARRVSHA